MEKKHWILANDENVRGYECPDGYVSKMITGDEMAGAPVININMGSVPAGIRTGGETHRDTEINMIREAAEGSIVILDEDRLPVKAGDCIVIPGGTFHALDNTKGDRPIIIYTVWPSQEQNGMYHIRQREWGTCVAWLDEEYTRKRMEGDR